jgi:hypothetical protein
MSFIKSFHLFENYKLPQSIDNRLEDDGKGNYLFYHYSPERRSKIKPGTGQNTLKTARDEIAALSSVGGLGMYYVSGDEKEFGMGPWQHIIKVPYDEVYYFNEDALDLYEVAYNRFRERYNGVDRPLLAFNPNYQVAWITKVANERGFKMIVAEWSRSLRAQTGIELTPDLIKKDNY